MGAFIEVSIDLTAQELLAPPAPLAMIEVDDIGALEPLPQAQSSAANSPQPLREPAAADVIEIELSADQMDALLGQ